MANTKRRTVLVVDDEPVLCDLLRDIFYMEGFEVLSANSGNQAQQVFDKHEVDAVVTDIRMPDGTGVELFESVKKKLPEKVPIFVFISGYSDLSPDEAKELGAHSYFAKPFDSSELLESVKAGLGLG